jgi:hypothetical protein
VVELDEDSDVGEVPARPRRAMRNTGKAKEASASTLLEEVKRELRALEGKLKNTLRELYEDGERLHRVLESLPPSL